MISLDDILVVILVVAPIGLLTIVSLRELFRWRKLNTEDYPARWRWIHFSEPEVGQQKHLVQGQNHKARWCVFRLDEKRLCRFRLPFGISQLYSIGQITWDGHEIHVEGRVSRLTLASPVIAAIWLAVIMGVISIRSAPAPSIATLLAIVGGFAVGVCVLLGAMGLVLSVFERMYFRRACREIKSHIWHMEK